MSTSKRDNHCVIKGSLEEKAYQALFQQFTGLDSPDLKGQNTALNTKLEELRKENQANKDADLEKQIKDMEALQAEYLKYYDLVANKERQIKYIPIFSGEQIQDLEVIIPNCAHLKGTIQDNPFTNRSNDQPETGTSLTTSSNVTRLGLEMPANAIFKVNYDTCTMIFDSSNKIIISPNKDDGIIPEEKIRLFQKHVLASVVSSPDAPIHLNFPKSIDEKRKFEIINEMIIAYMSVTGPKGEIDSKGSEARREQFIKNLIAGGSIETLDTISVGKKDKPNIYTGGITRADEPLTKELQETMKQMNRQDILMKVFDEINLDENKLTSMAKDRPWESVLATREVLRLGTNAVVVGVQTITRRLEGLISSRRNDNDDKYELYSRQGIDEDHKRIIRACVADIILKVASNKGPIKAEHIFNLDSFKKLNDPKTFNMQTEEVLALLNSDKIKGVMDGIKQAHEPTTGPTS